MRNSLGLFALPLGGNLTLDTPSAGSRLHSGSTSIVDSDPCLTFCLSMMNVHRPRAALGRLGGNPDRFLKALIQVRRDDELLFWWIKSITHFSPCILSVWFKCSDEKWSEAHLVRKEQEELRAWAYVFRGLSKLNTHNLWRCPNYECRTGCVLQSDPTESLKTVGQIMSSAAAPRSSLHTKCTHVLVTKCGLLKCLVLWCGSGNGSLLRLMHV